MTEASGYEGSGDDHEPEDPPESFWSRFERDFGFAVGPFILLLIVGILLIGMKL